MNENELLNKVRLALRSRTKRGKSSILAFIIEAIIISIMSFHPFRIEEGTEIRI